VVVEQAKGILAERLGLTPDEAFGVLRRAARNFGVRVHNLARSVIDSHHTPKEIVAELHREAAARKPV
jgi:AmiR/NasT family two-component response regulator